VLRIACPTIFCAASAAWAAARGIPASRDTLTAWVLVGLLAFSVTNFRRWARGLVYDWLPFVVVLWLYDLTRGSADGLLFHTHYAAQIDVDRALFGVVPTVWLQEHLWHGQAHLRWYDYASWLVYLSHFFATTLLAAALWLLAPHRFHRYVATVVTLALLGVTTYALFPAAPPWLATSHHLIHAYRLTPAVWSHVPYVNFQTLFEKGARYSNQVAAVPSLHTAFALLVSVTLWPIVPRMLRPLLVLYPIAMGFSLVYLGEHYVVDVLLGYVYVAAALAIVHMTARALERRRAAAPSAPPPAPAEA